MRLSLFVILVASLALVGCLSERAVESVDRDNPRYLPDPLGPITVSDAHGSTTFSKNPAYDPQKGRAMKALYVIALLPIDVLLIPVYVVRSHATSPQQSDTTANVDFANFLIELLRVTWK